MTERMALPNSIVDLAAVFGDLAAAERWVCWREEQHRGRLTKVPYSARTGRKASSTDSATWTTLREAQAKRERAGYHGVGIVLGDGFGGVDLDACRDPETGTILPWATKVIGDFRSYTEISPSGTGVKILAFGAPAALPAHTIPMDTPAINGKRAAIETYVGDRFFTVTGRILDAAPDQIRNCGAVGDGWDRMVELLRQRSSGDGQRRTGKATGVAKLSTKLRSALQQDRRLRALWEVGKDGGADRSRNDAALAATLAAKGYNDEDIEAAIRSYPLGQVGQGALQGNDADRQISRLLGIAATARERRNGRSGAEAGERDLTQDGLALEMGDQWLNARYVAAWAQWLFYDGSIWHADETLAHLTRCRRFLRRKAEALEAWAEREAETLGAEEADKLRRRIAAQATALRSAITVAQVVGLTRSNIAQAATVEQWDQDPFTLGTPARSKREPKP